jgi:hypothetical protein
MGRHTGNREVVQGLQVALENFLADHRKAAESDPEWMEGTKEATPEELVNEPGCGCDDCIFAGTLLGRIY